MKSTLAVLLATTAVIGALGLPALAGMRGTGDASGHCGAAACAAEIGDADQTLPLIRVSGDNDDDEGGWFRKGKGRDHDDDDDDEDDDDDCDDDDCQGAKGNPAPAGTVAPPANGLFGSGKPPVAVTN